MALFASICLLWFGETPKQVKYIYIKDDFEDFLLF